jgi:hypothetical protein
LSFDQAIVINPRYAPAWMDKGKCLQKIGRLEEAEGCFAVARSLPRRHELADIL